MNDLSVSYTAELSGTIRLFASNNAFRWNSRCVLHELQALSE